MASDGNRINYAPNTSASHIVNPHTEAILSQWSYEPAVQNELAGNLYQPRVALTLSRQRSPRRRGPKRTDRPAESAQAARNRQAQRSVPWETVVRYAM